MLDLGRFPAAACVATLVVLVLSIAPASAIGGPHPSATGAAAGGLEGVVDARRVDADGVVRGTISTPEGRPAAGASVLIRAWPKLEKLQAMAVGDPLVLTPLGHTTTDGAGRFMLRIDPEVDLSGLWSDVGTMDVDLVAVQGGNAASYSFSLVPARSGITVEEAADDVFVAHVDHATGRITKPMRVDLTFGNPSATRLGGHIETVSEEGVNEPWAGSDDFSIAWTGGACPGGPGLKANLGNRWVNVGEIHIAASGKDMRFTYSGSASSTLGVGISNTGAFGSFSASGTVDRSRSNATTFPWYTSSTSRFLDTLYSYGRYCVELVGGGYRYHRYEARAIRHEGGTDHRSTSQPTASYCVSYNVPGSGGEKSTSNAITWSNGAKLGGVIGIDLSSRTGYRTDAKIEYVFRTAGRLCGTHDLPNGTPRRLVMRS